MFGELNRGEEVTADLGKVDKREMLRKSPSSRDSDTSTVLSSTGSVDASIYC